MISLARKSLIHEWRRFVLWDSLLVFRYFIDCSGGVGAWDFWQCGNIHKRFLC